MQYFITAIDISLIVRVKWKRVFTQSINNFLEFRQNNFTAYNYCKGCQTNRLFHFFQHAPENSGVDPYLS
jgi:hypothetical protein